MAQPAEVVVNVKLDTTEARRQVRRLRKSVRDVDVALAKLEESLDPQLASLAHQLQEYGIRLEVEE